MPGLRQSQRILFPFPSPKIQRPLFRVQEHKHGKNILNAIICHNSTFIDKGIDLLWERGAMQHPSLFRG